MLKLTIDHVSAICRAEGDMQPHIVPNMVPNHRKQIEDDLERLSEVKKYILNGIYAPGLPIHVETSKDPELHGDKSKTS